MNSSENNKLDVISFVYNAKLALDSASQCFVVGELVDLPEAFPIAEKHLHTLRTTFDSIHTKLNGEYLSEVYPNSSIAAQAYCSYIAYVKEILEIAKCSSDNSELKMKKYQRIVQDNNGVGLEKAMLYLIKCARVVAKKPFVSDKQKEALREAQDEMKDLPPAFNDSSMGDAIMNHHSSGHQFNHGGTGHQNICNSGFQITGNNDRGVYNYMIKSNEVDES
ncbi:uncharacterized protein TrAtP1_013142 [Trichoderma atroviride]|uniref:uncharacterized protein n=1 Tax=Hypocrea atroviridis TaxID=63577 RepID=UPI0033242772|nr:hypothetical protein TrAtP1_013142 [Trichoderma atroviride]